jgi:hypothetical protein
MGFWSRFQPRERAWSKAWRYAARGVRAQASELSPAVHPLIEYWLQVANDMLRFIYGFDPAAERAAAILGADAASMTSSVYAKLLSTLMACLSRMACADEWIGRVREDVEEALLICVPDIHAAAAFLQVPRDDPERRPLAFIAAQQLLSEIGGWKDMPLEAKLVLSERAQTYASGSKGAYLATSARTRDMPVEERLQRYSFGPHFVAMPYRVRYGPILHSDAATARRQLSELFFFRLWVAHVGMVAVVSSHEHLVDQVRKKVVAEAKRGNTKVGSLFENAFEPAKDLGASIEVLCADRMEGFDRAAAKGAATKGPDGVYAGAIIDLNTRIDIAPAMLPWLREQAERQSRLLWFEAAWLGLGPGTTSPPMSEVLGNE